MLYFSFMIEFARIQLFYAEDLAQREPNHPFLNNIREDALAYRGFLIYRIFGGAEGKDFSGANGDRLLQETHSSIDRVREPSPYISGLLEKVLGFTTFVTESGTLAQVIAGSKGNYASRLGFGSNRYRRVKKR